MKSQLTRVALLGPMLLLSSLMTHPAHAQLPNIVRYSFSFENTTLSLEVDTENAATGAFTGVIRENATTTPVSGTISASGRIQFSRQVNRNTSWNYTGALDAKLMWMAGTYSITRPLSATPKTAVQAPTLFPFCAKGIPIPQ